MCLSPLQVGLDIIQCICAVVCARLCVCVYDRARKRETDCRSVSLNLRCLPVGVYANSNSVRDVSCYSDPGETSVNELIGDLMP